jgi:hypothetical protein
MSVEQELADASMPQVTKRSHVALIRASHWLDGEVLLLLSLEQATSPDESRRLNAKGNSELGEKFIFCTPLRDAKRSVNMSRMFLAKPQT